MFYSSTAYPSTHLFKNCFDPIPKGTPARWLGVGLSQGRVWRRRGGEASLYPWAHHLPQGTLALAVGLSQGAESGGGGGWSILYPWGGASIPGPQEPPGQKTWYPGTDGVIDPRYPYYPTEGVGG